VALLALESVLDLVGIWISTLCTVFWRHGLAPILWTLSAALLEVASALGRLWIWISTLQCSRFFGHSLGHCGHSGGLDRAWIRISASTPPWLVPQVGFDSLATLCGTLVIRVAPSLVAAVLASIPWSLCGALGFRVGFG
jgi:hypothetical protein